MTCLGLATLKAICPHVFLCLPDFLSVVCSYLRILVLIQLRLGISVEFASISTLHLAAEYVSDLSIAHARS